MWFYLYKLDMNKDSIFSFLKKYPISILLSIIAINLFSIAGTLKENGKILKENGNEPERLIKFWLGLDKGMKYSSKFNSMYTSIFE